MDDPARTTSIIPAPFAFTKGNPMAFNAWLSDLYAEATDRAVPLDQLRAIDWRPHFNCRYLPVTALYERRLISTTA